METLSLEFWNSNSKNLSFCFSFQKFNEKTLISQRFLDNATVLEDKQQVCQTEEEPNRQNDSGEDSNEGDYKNPNEQKNKMNKKQN